MFFVLFSVRYFALLLVEQPVDACFVSSVQ